jgi:GH15 family glucan-1,4-alpha-glucosidase
MRIVQGLAGRVPMQVELRLRPDYGRSRRGLDPSPDGVVAVAGPDAFRLSTPLDVEIRDGTASASFDAVEGSSHRFTLTWWESHKTSPPVEDADSALARTEAWWREWSGRCTYDGEYHEAVLTSLIALKAMTAEPTGALIAAPTTSLPEDIGGVRNWGLALLLAAGLRAHAGGAAHERLHRRGGQPGGEGQFLACSFWLVSALALNGRIEEARSLFERLLDLRNDVGLLAEEYDVPRRRQVGNFPQPFSHLALIEAAKAISSGGQPTRADAPRHPASVDAA